MNYDVEVVKEPTGECVTRDELRRQARLNTDDADDGADLDRYIGSARQAFELETRGRIVLPTVFRQHMHSWAPALERNCHASVWPYGWLPVWEGPHWMRWKDRIPLMRGSVFQPDTEDDGLRNVSVKYYDENDALQTLDSSLWGVDLVGIPAVVYFKGTLPVLSSVLRYPVQIEYTAGWQTPEAVPARVKQGILLAAAFYLEVREAYSPETYVDTPMGFQRICMAYHTGLEAW